MAENADEKEKSLMEKGKKVRRRIKELEKPQEEIERQDEDVETRPRAVSPLKNHEKREELFAISNKIIVIVKHFR